MSYPPPWNKPRGVPTIVHRLHVNPPRPGLELVRGGSHTSTVKKAWPCAKL